MALTTYQQRKKRHQKVRTKIAGNAARPRLSVFRSNQGIYAQLINDEKGEVIAAASSMKLKKTGMEAAKQVGTDIAKAAKAKKIDQCVFDRSGYLYHGRVKALAEGAREGGLNF